MAAQVIIEPESLVAQGRHGCRTPGHGVILQLETSEWTGD